MKETQEEKIVRLLHCSLEEAKDIIQCDKQIDHNEKMPFDLSKEEEKLAKKWANSTTKQKKTTVYKWEKKERKANPTKENIINTIYDSLKNSDLNVSDLIIVNKGKIITFKINDTEFKVDLIQHRNKKG